MSNPNMLPAIARQLEQLRRQLEHVTERLDRVESRLGIEAPPADSSAAPARPATGGGAAPGSRLPAPWEGDRQRPREATAPHPAPGARRPGTAGDWERLIGGKWALWIGSVAVFLAIAFFLAYTWQHLPPAGRLWIGLLAGLAFLGAGGAAYGRVESWFSAGLTGGGLAILYLTVWTGAQRYGLLSFPTAFVLMVAVTASGVVLALRANAVSLAALATLGGFLTPVVIRAGGGDGEPLPFLTYVALLNAGILAVSLSRRWRALIWLSVTATLLLVAGWAEPEVVQRHRGALLAFVTLYFLMYVGAACFYSLIRRERTDPQDLLLLFAVAFLYALTGQGLLASVLAPAHGAFALALALAFALLADAVHRLAPENATLRDAGAGLALFFLTIAVPIQLRQGWVAIAWSLQAVVLLTISQRRGSRLLARAGEVVWALSLLAVAGVLLTTEPTRRLLFLNERALPLLISVLGAAWLTVATACRGWDGAGERPSDRTGDRLLLAGIFAGYTVLGGAWLIAQETYLGFGWRRIPSAATWPAAALYAVASLWALAAPGAFVAGARLRLPALRTSALALLLLAALLPLLVGLTGLAADWTPFWNLRWLAFVTVAVATLALLRWMAGERDVAAGDQRFQTWIGRAGVVLVLLWGVTQETYETFRYYQEILGTHWDRAAQMGISLIWSVGGALLLVGGIARRSQSTRVLALALLGVTVLKVFLFDLGFLDTGYRVLSFAGLGVALIGISWLYSRYGAGADGPLPEVLRVDR
jgi:uncharacterized membrane protein